MRFWRLVARGLDEALFEAITVPLREKAITAKTGALVDATIMASVSKDDGDGRWVKHREGRACGPPLRYQAQAGADATHGAGGGESLGATGERQ